MLIAITREVSPAINQAELTHIDRIPIDVKNAQRQHHAYNEALRSLGCQVIALPAEPDLPDSVFVEDTALVLDEVAVITRPGADSRKPETASIMHALQPYRKLISIEAPGTLDGGDILRLGKQIYVGLSTRSNQSAIDQLQQQLGPLGYTVHGVALYDCLHLKSAVTQVGERMLLVNPRWIDLAPFAGWELIEVDPSEPGGANALLLNGVVIYPQEHVKTIRRLEARGVKVLPVPASELAKAEGGVTCCSLIFKQD